ncbi:hypothetical protein HK405_014517, partial [Cladochytrium tenue]
MTATSTSTTVVRAGDGNDDVDGAGTGAGGSGSADATTAVGASSKALARENASLRTALAAAERRSEELAGEARAAVREETGRLNSGVHGVRRGGLLESKQ